MSRNESPSVRVRLAAVAAALVAALSGCEQNTATISADNPQLAAFVQLILPRAIEIQRYLTRPQSLDASGDINGVEVILATKDAFGDGVKCVGTFTFELYTRRMASGDEFGERVGLWRLSIDSEEKLKQYWDHISKFYRFPLQLEQRTLAPGKYILTAQLIGPTGEKLFDRYELEHGGQAGAKPPEPATR